MWVIDENAIIDLSLVWFIPIIEPITALIIGISIMKVNLMYKNTIIDNGASFCQVDKIIHDIQDIDDITDGNHIWHGAIPSFISRDTINIVEI